MNTTTIASFRPLVIPETLSSPDAADFLEMVRVRNIVLREISGDGDDVATATELLAGFRPSEDRERVSWIVLIGEEVVGRILVDIPQESGSRVAFWWIELLRSVHGQGIGSAAHDLVVEAATERGRTILQTWVRHPESDDERLEPPTGFGSIPKDHAARFLLRHDYSLEQVERKSVLSMVDSATRIDDLFQEAREASDGYDLVQWVTPTPEADRADFAWLKSRMSTDAPSAGMEMDEEAWDTARVDRAEARYAEGGLTVLITAARHRESGRLVAFNELALALETDPTRTTDQWTRWSSPSTAATSSACS